MQEVFSPHGVLATVRAPCAIPPIRHEGVYSLKALLADWKLVRAMGGAAIAALAMIAYAFFRPAVNPEAEERKRRLHLNQIGRIAEGQVVELVEHAPESKEARKG